VEAPGGDAPPRRPVVTRAVACVEASIRNPARPALASAGRCACKDLGETSDRRAEDLVPMAEKVGQ